MNPILINLTFFLLICAQALAAAAEKTNILFIISDQQFAEAMSCRMAKEFINTPNMDRLAQTGTLFTRAYSANPLCMPSRNSIFTGCYPHETPVTRNEGAMKQPLSNFDTVTLACFQF